MKHLRTQDLVNSSTGVLINAIQLITILHCMLNKLPYENTFDI